jgi:hypothetical protein
VLVSVRVAVDTGVGKCLFDVHLQTIKRRFVASILMKI